MLLENENKSARERLTLVLRGFGYSGSYDAVRRYGISWRKERGAALAQAYVPLSLAPGEAYQFDWSHEVVVLNGATVTVKVAHMQLCHSRMLFARAYPRETQEMVFDAHDRVFRHPLRPLSSFPLIAIAPACRQLPSASIVARFPHSGYDPRLCSIRLM